MNANMASEATEAVPSASTPLTSDQASADSSASTPWSCVSDRDFGSIDSDDVAIIGMACRTSGGNDSPEKLWKFLMDKQDASGENPAWRWEAWKQRDPRNAKLIDKTINKGYFINDLENFDAAFFGISPKEAEQMDPHQRLGLEITWEALENAGINPKSLSGSDTAVYMGVDSDDYSRLLLEDLPNIEAWMGIGTTAHGIPNRISYHLDLMGPSAATDAACASSLVAVHSGRLAIMSGESKMAIVGGVNVCLSPALFHMLGAAGALSPDGVCQSFDDDAHGYARGEGGAVLILKRLRDAIADNDRILSTIKGVAVAQDGKTNGIMAPNAKAQELVARKALKQGNIDPLTVGFVEAHATSTSLGDPTELSAISKVYGTGRPMEAPVAVGSIKPNVGHLEAAAGAISLVKAVLAINKGQIPPQTRLEKLNSRVDWENSGIKVVREKTIWRESDGPRRAAVCSYGYGGTVSHAVIEQSPIVFRGRRQEDPSPTLLLISAPQEKRLTIQTATQAAWLTGAGRSENIKDIASTLAQRRAHHEFRAAFVVDSHEQASKILRKHSENGAIGDLAVQGRTLGHGVSKDTVWVFSGHGAQWDRMGLELLQDPVFCQAITPLDAIVHRELQWSAIDVLRSGNFEHGDQIQVLTYLVQVGLTQVLKSKGITPHAIIGHSVGELAAAVAAGALTAEEGTVIVTRRARLYATVMNLGGMYLVNLPFSSVATELAGRTDIAAAISSSPSSCVISGATEAVSQYVELLNGRGVRTFKVNSDIAFHSPMLDPLEAPLRKVLSGELKPQSPSVKLYSTSQHDPRSSAPRDIDYWAANMTGPVLLTSAVGAAVEDGYRIFLEVSAHPIVSHSVNEILEHSNADDFVVVPTLKKNKSIDKMILHSIAQLHVKGAHIDFTATLGGQQWSSKVPGFKWSQKPYWKQVSCGSAVSENAHDVETHTMLGQRSIVAGTGMTLFTTRIDEPTKPFPRPHELHGTNIIPAAVYINTFYHATGGGSLSDMTLRVPLAITEQSRNVQVVVEEGSVKVASRLTSADDNSWVTHSQAKWSKQSPEATLLPFTIEAIKERIGTVLPKNFSVDYLAKVGVAGIAFPWAVLEHYGNSTEMMALVDNDPDSATISWSPESWAPTLDAASSIGSTVFNDGHLRIVSGIDNLTVYSTAPAPKVFYIYSEETDAAADDPQTRSADVTVLSTEGEVLAKFSGIRLSQVDVTQKAQSTMDGLVHQLAWVPARLSEYAVLPEHVVLISDDANKLQRYEQALRRQVKNVVCIDTAQQLEYRHIFTSLQHSGAAIMYLPGHVDSLEHVSAAAQKYIWEVASAVRFIVERGLSTKIFIATDGIHAAETPTALAQGPLVGLARVAALEHSDIWGALIDNDGLEFPFLPFKYVHGQDIIRFIDGVPKVARFRPFSKKQRYVCTKSKTLLPKPEGTYVITGGLGDLGLETCDFLVEKGARRVVVISRRALPPRAAWASTTGAFAKICKKIQDLEKRGASIHVVPLDIGAEDADKNLLDALDRLSLPPVLGVIHASGVLEDNLLVKTTADSFARVLSPKMDGAIALHKAFPSGTLDFFVLFSSIGQLVGTSGQSSYGSGNAFLDTLATHRRQQGDNAIAFQFTAWRGLGMGASTDFLTIELQSKGITDITREEGFRAWEHLSDFDTDHAVVTRVLTFDEDEPLPTSLLEEVAPRRARAQDSAASDEGSSGKGDSDPRPTSGPELMEWLSVKIREVIGSIMKMDDIEEIDPRVAIADMGIDSVMTISLGTKLQKALKQKVPQTLTWNYPTVAAMADYFAAQGEAEADRS